MLLASEGTGKEYIGDISEIANAVREALRKCCNQIKKALSVKRQRQNQESRMKNLQKYVPTVASSLFNVLGKHMLWINKPSNNASI